MDQETSKCFVLHSKRAQSLEDAVANLIELVGAVIEAVDLLNRATSPVQVTSASATGTDVMAAILTGPEQAPRALPSNTQLCECSKRRRTRQLERETPSQKQARLHAENKWLDAVNRSRARLAKDLGLLVGASVGCTGGVVVSARDNMQPGEME